MSKLFFIGDSIAAGAWDCKGGWAARVCGHIMNKAMTSDIFYCLPYNLGVSGDTYEDALQRIETEIRSRCIENEPAIDIVVALGTNDSCWEVDANTPRFSDEALTNNIEQMVNIARNLKANLFLIGVPPVDELLLNPIPWAPERAYKNQQIERVESIIGTVAKTHNIPFLPLYETCLKQQSFVKTYLFDGVHPNSKGHQFIAEKISDYLLTPTFFQRHQEG